MEKIRAEKLSDDSLDQVTGGTDKEMFELKKAMGVTTLRQIEDELQDNGIRYTLSSTEKNRYSDPKTGNTLSHEDVLKRVQK